MIKPFYRGRHYLWANFYIGEFHKEALGFDTLGLGFNNKGSPHISPEETYDSLIKYLGFSSDRKIPIKLLQNCVFPPLGQHIINCARGNTQQPLTAFKQSLRIDQE